MSLKANTHQQCKKSTLRGVDFSCEGKKRHVVARKSETKIYIAEAEREPGIICPNGNRRQVERSETASNLLEGGTVARVSSKEEPVVRSQDGPAAPQRLRNKEQPPVFWETKYFSGIFVCVFIKARPSPCCHPAPCVCSSAATACRQTWRRRGPARSSPPTSPARWRSRSPSLPASPSNPEGRTWSRRRTLVNIFKKSQTLSWSKRRQTQQRGRNGEMIKKAEGQLVSKISLIIKNCSGLPLLGNDTLLRKAAVVQESQVSLHKKHPISKVSSVTERWTTVKFVSVIS